MKSFWLLLVVLAVAPRAHATPVTTVQFVEYVVVTTDTFESTNGNVLFTKSAVAFSDYLSPNIAADISADLTVVSAIENTVPLIPQVSEYQFLSTQGSDYVVLNGAGPAFTGSTGNASNDGLLALEAAAGPGYGVVSEIPISLGISTYETGAVAPDGSIWQGDITFDFFALNAVEQPVSAPEPAALGLLACGFFVCLLGARPLSVKKLLWRLSHK